MIKKKVISLYDKMKPLFCDETYTKLLNQIPEEVIGDRDILKKTTGMDLRKS